MASPQKTAIAQISLIPLIISLLVLCADYIVCGASLPRIRDEPDRHR